MTAALPTLSATDRWLAVHRRELDDALDALQADGQVIERWGHRLATHLAAGGRLLAAGNGGSAAEAQHLTAELVGRFAGERRALSAIALCAESASVTAIVNDYGADEVFARQVEAHGRTDDVLVLLSTSGRSPNVVHAAEVGRRLGLHVWTLTGRYPNPLAAAATSAVCVHASTTAVVQAVHLVAVHALCAAVDHHLPSADGRATQRRAASTGRRPGDARPGRGGRDGVPA
ncbi:SIS domain-containing protein [Cellulomonas fimi]|uniref:D-sedoheptulose-7-phosphate isomerase n=1 Tax=Cellulomonas fimi TaxID=1708 RepID=UPI00234C82D1|nr:SIS domain-containing protein [Cellulomonas fimi]MDC7122752.1 SIS domain-containing protein [Cellulomonas fimi]